MIDLKRHQLWLAGILVVLIGAATWLFISRLPLYRLRSGDVLIYDQEKIWLLNPADYTLSLMLEPEQNGILEYVAEFQVSPKHDYMYLMARETTKRYVLFRYDLKNRDLRVVARFPTPAQIRSVFPDGKHAMIMMYPPDPALTYACVLEFDTGDCLRIDPDISLGDLKGLWLSRDTMLTASIDRGITLLSLKESQLSVERILKQPGVSFYGSDLMSDCCVIVAAYKEGRPVLLRLDRSSLEVTELPVVPTDYGAAFTDVSVSLDARYIAYGGGLHFEVKELSSNNTVATLDHILYFSWIRDTDSIVMYVEHSEYPGEPDELVVLDAATGKTQTILGLEHQVWFETVP